MLDQPLGFLNHHLGHLDMAGCGFVKGRADHLGPHRALHVRNLFGPLVNQQYDQDHFLMVLRDAMRNALQHHRFASTGSGHHQSPLPLADWREQVDDARGVFLWIVLEGELFLGIEWGEVIEENLLTGTFRLFVIDRLNFEEGEIPLAFLRRADLP